MTAQDAPVDRPTTARRRSLSPAWLGFAFVLPATLIFGLFLVLPVFAVAGMSLLEWTGFRIGDWQLVGLAKYQEMLADPVFWRAFTHTIVFTLATTLLLNVIGFSLALLITTRVRGSGLARAVIFLPVLISPVIVALMWSRILDAFGAVNQLIKVFDPTALPVLFLGSTTMVLPSLIVATVWQFAGYNMLLYYAGLQNVPQEQVEAASIDGASKRATIRHIVIPSIYPVIGIAVLLNVIGGLRIFDLVFVMTRGGPNRSSEVLATYMYEQAFKLSDMGYAAALAVVIVLLSVGAAVFRLRWGVAST